MKTVGDLKKELENYPDDMLVKYKKVTWVDISELTSDVEVEELPLELEQYTEYYDTNSTSYRGKQKKLEEPIEMLLLVGGY